jgi:hypothetical protein
MSTTTGGAPSSGVMVTPPAVPYRAAPIRDVAIQIHRAIERSPEWCHRKVETVMILEGDQGRRQLSVDCSPIDIGLIEQQNGSYVSNRQIVVPLVIAKKGRFTAFSMKNSQGQTLPLVERPLNSLYMALAVSVEFETIIGRLPDSVEWHHIYSMAINGRDEASLNKTGLLSYLRNRGDENSFPYLEPWFTDACESFLVLAVAAKGLATERQIIKLSYQWPSDCLESSLTEVDFWSAGLGLSPVSASIRVGSMDSCASYHLEIPLPDELLCSSARFVDLNGAPAAATLETGSVIHVALEDKGRAPDIVSLELNFGLERHALRAYTTIGALCGSCFFIGAALLPNAFANLAKNSDGTATLLLFGPALWLALAWRGREPNLAARLLRPFRAVAWVLASFMALAALSLIGGLVPGLREVEWLIFGGLSAVIFAALAHRKIPFVTSLLERATAPWRA